MSLEVTKNFNHFENAAHTNETQKCYEHLPNEDAVKRIQTSKMNSKSQVDWAESK